MCFLVVFFSFHNVKTSNITYHHCSGKACWIFFLSSIHHTFKKLFTGVDVQPGRGCCCRYRTQCYHSSYQDLPTTETHHQCQWRWRRSRLEIPLLMSHTIYSTQNEVIPLILYIGVHSSKTVDGLGWMAVLSSFLPLLQLFTNMIHMPLGCFPILIC